MRHGHVLRYTGTCDRGEFDRRCAEHDFWYHSYYFDNGFVKRGDYDIGLDIADYGFPADMTGMSVLDVGTGSGWFATYFEQCGADVTTVDVRGYCDFDVFGRHYHPPIEEEKPEPDLVLEDGRKIYYSPVSRGFWIMKDILGLKAEYVNSRVYDLRPELFGGKKFDLVFLGSLLMHVRDPIGAMMAARSVAADRLIANSLVPAADTEAGIPWMEFLHISGEGVSWWRPNGACLKRMVEAAGFTDVAITGTLEITTDDIFVDQDHRSTGDTQLLYNVSGRV